MATIGRSIRRASSRSTASGRARPDRGARSSAVSDADMTGSREQKQLVAVQNDVGLDVEARGDLFAQRVERFHEPDRIGWHEQRDEEALADAGELLERLWPVLDVGQDLHGDHEVEASGRDLVE